MKVETKSIIEMAQGAIMERLDYEMARIMENIMDPNTDATAKRKITLTLDLKPDKNRQTINVDATAKSTLAPTQPISLSLMTGFERGQFVAVEVSSNVPGQMQLAGEDEPERTMLKFPGGGVPLGEEVHA